jgi:hypothetical protein
MMKINYLVLLALTLLVLSACTSTSIDDRKYKGKEGYLSVLAIAKSRVQDARSVGGLWIDTEQLLVLSENLAERHHYKEAIEYARQAYFQADEGYKQQMMQKNMGNPGYLRGDGE